MKNAMPLCHMPRARQEQAGALQASMTSCPFAGCHWRRDFERSVDQVNFVSLPAHGRRHERRIVKRGAHPMAGPRRAARSAGGVHPLAEEMGLIVPMVEWV